MAWLRSDEGDDEGNKGGGYAGSGAGRPLPLGRLSAPRAFLGLPRRQGASVRLTNTAFAPHDNCEHRRQNNAREPTVYSTTNSDSNM